MDGAAKHRTPVLMVVVSGIGNGKTDKVHVEVRKASSTQADGVDIEDHAYRDLMNVNGTWPLSSWESVLC